MNPSIGGFHGKSPIFKHPIDNPIKFQTTLLSYLDFNQPNEKFRSRRES